MRKRIIVELIGGIPSIRLNAFSYKSGFAIFTRGAR
jgi:hypothetical protein